MGLRGVEDIKCVVSVCVGVCMCWWSVYVCECASVCVCADDLWCGGRSSTVCMTQIAGFMLSTRLQMVTGEASASLRTPCMTLFLWLLPPNLSSSPPVYICFALSYFDNDPIMGLSVKNCYHLWPLCLNRLFSSRKRGLLTTADP